MVTKSPTAFEFGKNWQQFLRHLDETRIRDAEISLQSMLGRTDLAGLTFLDAGCGSGIFSLAALRLGASQVLSLDVDEDSVNCARHLDTTYGPYPNWTIMSGSLLDKDWLAQLGRFDVVYSWGVLHHTGDMWTAFANIVDSVTDRGTLFISIYNDRGWISRAWLSIKRLYNRSPKAVQLPLATGYYLAILANRTIRGLLAQQPPPQWYRGSERGMTLWNDAVDWVGGYPFETASPEAVLHFFRSQGFLLSEMRLKRGSGCNEFVFVKVPNLNPGP